MPVKNGQAESGIFLKSLFDTFVSPGRVRTNVKIIAQGCSSCIMSATNALDTHGQGCTVQEGRTTAR